MRNSYKIIQFLHGKKINVFGSNKDFRGIFENQTYQSINKGSFRNKYTWFLSEHLVLLLHNQVLLKEIQTVLLFKKCEHFLSFPNFYLESRRISGCASRSIRIML